MPRSCLALAVLAAPLSLATAQPRALQGTTQAAHVVIDSGSLVAPPAPGTALLVVLRRLSDEGALRLHYNVDQVGSTRVRSVTATALPPHRMLERVLAGTGLRAVAVDDGFLVVAAARLAGQVRDSSGRRPVDGARVRLEPDGRVVFTDAAGRFGFGELSPGTRTVRITRLGFRPATATATVGSSGDIAIDITLVALATELSEIVTTAGRTDGYRGVRTSTGLKLDADIADVPMNVQIVPRQVAVDRGVQRIEEFVQTVSSVRPFVGFDFASGYQIRGVWDTYSNLRNGARDAGGQTDIANIERVEVMKGPNSVTLGANFGGGGVVNTITKKPQATPARTLEVVGGRFGYGRVNADVTGPIGTGERALFRLVAAGENADSHRAFADNRLGMFAPSLTLQLTPKDQLFVGYEYSRNRFQWLNPFPLDARFLTLPRNQSFTGPGLSQTTTAVSRPALEYTRQFGEAWRLRVAGSSMRYDIDIGEGRLYGQSIDSLGARVIRQVSRGPQRQRNDNASTELYGQFTTGPLRHRTVVGVDWFREDYFYRNELAFADTVALRNPVFPAAPSLSPFEFAFSGLSGASSTAGYVQDLIDVTPRLRVLLGGRVDRLRQFFDNYADGPRIRTPDSPPTQWKSRFSPRIGLVFEATKGTTVYGNAINSFIPNLGIFNFSGTGSVVQNGNPFPPTVAQQYELGVKQSLLDARVFATLAAYNIARTNVFTVDAGGNYVPTGKQRSRGVEFDLAGTLAPGWQLVANAAVTDATIRADDNIPVGSRVGNIPRTSGGLWTTYAWSSGSAHGLRVGGGAQYTGDVPSRLPFNATDTGAFLLPGATVIDAMASYERRGYRLGVNLKNLSNRTTWAGDGLYTFMAGRPFDVVVSLSTRF